jgi:serine protease Do
MRHSVITRFSASAYIVCAMLGGAMISAASAQRVRPEAPSRSESPRVAMAAAGGASRSGADPIVDAFRAASADAARSTVLIRCDGKNAAFGTIVGADGSIITKASELSGRITVHLRGGRSYDAKLIGVVEQHDLAMLKIAATNLPPVSWSRAADPEVGQLLATPGTTDVPVAVGVLSVGRRAIPSSNVLPGVLTGPSHDGLRVLQVMPGSSAATAGIEVDDVILAIAGQRVASREQLMNVINSHRPGEEVGFDVQRGEQRLAIRVVLVGRPTGAPSRADVMNAMGGPLSRVSTGFAAVFQHDTVLRPDQCGGPLVDLTGKVIGINIARAGRTESYAIPADVVQSLIPDLVAGKYPARLPQIPAPAPTSRPARARPGSGE